MDFDTFYCMKCQKRRQGVEIKEVKTKNGKNALKGKCHVCGTVVWNLLSKAWLWFDDGETPNKYYGFE